MDDTALRIPTVDPLPSKFLITLIWVQLGRDVIDFLVEYTYNWANLITVPLIEYTRHSFKVLSYCSSATEARDIVNVTIQSILRTAGVSGGTVVLTDSDGILMKYWLVDLFAGEYQARIVR